MPPLHGKDPKSAYARYVDGIKPSINCITREHLVTNCNPTPGEEFFFAFSNQPAGLSDSPYQLFLMQKVKIIPDPKEPECWKVSTLAYEYNIERKRDNREVICFHWHGGDDKPHIHIGSAMLNGSDLSNKMHIPSARVSVEDVVDFCMKELGVRALPDKRGVAERVIQAARDQFNRFKTWG